MARVYVSSQGTNRVTMVDGNTLTIEKTVPAPDQPGATVLDPSRKRLFVVGRDEVIVYDAASLQQLSNFQAPNAGRIAFVASKNQLLLGTTGEIEVRDASSFVVLRTIPFDGFPGGIAVDACGCYAYVTGARHNNVSVVNLQNDTIVATIDVDQGPININLTRDSRLAFVTNFGSNTVSVIDVRSRKVVNTIAATSPFSFGDFIN